MCNHFTLIIDRRELMNIAIDGRTIAGDKTGVGNYAERIVRALLQCDSRNHYYLFLSEPNDHIAGPNLTKFMIEGYGPQSSIDIGKM